MAAAKGYSGPARVMNHRLFLGDSSSVIHTIWIIILRDTIPNAIILNVEISKDQNP